MQQCLQSATDTQEKDRDSERRTLRRPQMGFSFVKISTD